jgi:hypothetical protein
MTVQSGDLVAYLGHAARVIHVFTTTANIRLTVPVAGMSRQQDVYLSALLPAGYARP